MSDKDWYDQGFTDGKEAARKEVSDILSAAKEWAEGYQHIIGNIVKSEEESDVLYRALVKQGIFKPKRY